MLNTFIKPNIKNKKVVNVKEPQLYRDVFPYTEVPRIKFDNLVEPYNFPQDIWITDTTFRDGQQAMPPYSVKQILQLFEFLHKLGGPEGIIKFSEFFLYSDKDKEAVEKCLEQNYEFPKITGWIRANKKDFQLVKDMNLKETGILTSCSDYHIFLKFNSDRKSILEKYLDVVKDALDNDIVPRCHFEDITRADIYGFVIPFAQELMKLSEESKKPVKIRLCDTMGMGINYPGVQLPRSIPKLLNAMIHDAGVPSEYLEWHGHNDFHKVHINGVSAWLYGASGINGTLLGFGERTGNSPIEGLLMEYIGLKGDTNGIDTTIITDIAEFYRKMGVRIPDNFPFIGRNFNVTRAGIHADGVLKNAEIYTIFDADKILKAPVGIGITDKSGVAGLAFWINSYFDLPEEQKVDKHHPGLLKIYKWVMKEYEEHRRTTSVSDQELERLAKKHIPEIFKTEWQEIKASVGEEVKELLEEVAASKEIRSMDVSKMEKSLKKVLHENPYIQLIAVTDMEGNRITDNITQVVDKHKYESFTSGNFCDRPWFINTVKTGKTYISDFYTSKITDTLCITAATPVFDEDEKEMKAILEFDIKFEEAVKL